MNTSKPIGGKQKGVYIMFPEEEYNRLRDYAKKNGMDPDQYCEKIIRDYFSEAHFPREERI